MTLEDLKREKLADERITSLIEEKCMSDYDYAVEQAGFDVNMTIDELSNAVSMMNAWGWDMDICDALEDLL